MRLTGQQYQQLSDALVRAFPTPFRLQQMVQVRLDRNLATIASLVNPLDHVVFELIQEAQAGGWTEKLLLAARQSQPDNPDLLAFAQLWGLAPAGAPSRPALEKIIKTTNSYLDVSAWRRKLGEVEGRVCRVEVAGGTSYGTGFLLGPNVVMTNHHVLADVIAGNGGGPADVLLRFDYKRLADGTTLNEGTVYRLPAEDWLIDSSPPDPIDTLPEPKAGVPAPDRLDYALLRVDGTPGADTIGGAAEPEAAVRGWIPLPDGERELVPGSALYIMQHPQAAPLKLAIDTEAVIGTNANGTRLTYRTNTEPGSSGSPCFNHDWDLVALHHSGDPGYGTPLYNEGIPLRPILALLKERGLAGELGEQQL